MFSPYHRFSNCRKLENVVNALNTQGGISQEVFRAFNRYHFALVHKLKCAKSQVDNLDSLLSAAPSQEILSDSSDFIFKVNMSLDGFFYFSGSALDILAREVLSYFGLPLPNNVYFEKARSIISDSRPGDPILNRLNNPPWKSDFSMYRNALTHELTIARQFNINVWMDGATQRQTLILPLPDDPRVDPDDRTFRKYPDATKYCKSHMRRLLKLINIIYGDIHIRTVSNSGLPL